MRYYEVLLSSDAGSSGRLESFLSDHVTRAGRWFLESGIQEPCGGVARFYRSDAGVNARVSTEITGYAISTFLYLHAATGEAAYLEAAQRAGRFLLDSAWDHEAATFAYEYSVDGQRAAPLGFFFDAGIILRSLLGLYRATGIEEWLLAGEACGISMARDFRAGPEFHPVLSLPGKQAAPPEARWSRRPGCYQLKAALGWYELWEAAGRAEFRARYEQVLEQALETHTTFLPGEGPREGLVDRLHAYCYFLEGLLPGVGRQECARALDEGLDRASRLADEIAPQFERSDVLAQLLRLQLLAAALGLRTLDAERAAQQVARITRYQLEHDDPRIRGGFCFGRKGHQLLPFVNPVSTAFCLQALRMWRQFQAGQLDPAWRTLI